MGRGIQKKKQKCQIGVFGELSAFITKKCVLKNYRLRCKTLGKRQISQFLFSRKFSNKWCNVYSFLRLKIM